MFDLNKKGYPNSVLNILNELKGMEIREAQEMLDSCGEFLLNQTCTGWTTCMVDDKHAKIIPDSRNIRDESYRKMAGNQGTTVNHFTINISGNSGEQGTAPSGHAGSRSGWHGKFYTNNPVEMAYRILLLLEEAKVPRMCVDSILEAVKSILDFQEVVVTPGNMENPNFPK